MWVYHLQLSRNGYSKQYSKLTSNLFHFNFILNLAEFQRSFIGIIIFQHMVEDKCLKQVFSVTDSDGNLSLLVQRYFIRILQYDTFKGMKLNAINV